MTITSTPGRTEPKKPSEPEGPEAHGDRRPVPPSDPSRRNGAVLVGFTAVTNLADGVMRLALPLLAVRLTDSPALVTTASLALTLPWLLTALHIGVVVDRFDRRMLLWLAGAARVAAMGGLFAAAVTGHLTLGRLLAAGAVLGVADVLAATAGSALVPAAVAREHRPRVNAWTVGAETVGQEFAGPFVGGLLLAAGTGLALGAIGVTYAAAALLLVLLAGRFRPAAPAPGTPAVPVNTRIAEGLRLLWRDPVLRTLSLTAAALNAVWGAWLALMPLHAHQAMGLGPGEYGFLLSGLGIGGLVGAVTVTWVNRLLGPRRAMLADLLGTCAMTALPALTTSLWAVAAGAFLGGMGGTLWAVNSRTLTQHKVPDALLGRYTAASRLLCYGALPIGTAAAGLLAELLGTRTVFAVISVLALTTVIPFLRRVKAADLTGTSAP
ncbi:MFS transporter [Streptomyces albidoflavus]